MVECWVVVVNRLGLHARAASQVVRLASRFHSTIKLEREDGSAVADAKSILSVLMLAAARGTRLRATAEGVDEREALDSLCKLFAEGFGEEAEK
ncbi:MAG TPA: HPr family phosphocarrier protein [Pyrinomonadaceae bacterium]|jgi:phosphotransferase system HPr (HPr) family protein